MELAAGDESGMGGVGEEVGDFFGGDEGEFDENAGQGRALAALFALGQVELFRADQARGDQAFAQIVS